MAEAERYRAALARLESLEGDLLRLFSDPQRAGRVELLASSATHAVLPMLATRAARNLQLDAGLRSHRRRFGEPRGFWLPECAYEPGLEGLLAARGLEYFCTDQSAAEGAAEALAPVSAEAGTLAFTIDWEAVAWLWSLDGYPSDPVFADFHRKSLRGSRPWSIAGEPYDPERGEQHARELGRRFAAAAAARLRAYADERGRPGLLVFAIDTELLGHWWWEGPTWLEQVLGAAGEHGIELVTLGEARERHPGERANAAAIDLGRGQGPAHLGLARRRRHGLGRAAAGVARAAGPPRHGARAGDRARGARAARRAGERLGLPRSPRRGRRLSLAAQHRARSRTARGDQLVRASAPPRLRNLAPDLSLAPLLEP